MAGSHFNKQHYRFCFQLFLKPSCFWRTDQLRLILLQRTFCYRSISKDSRWRIMSRTIELYHQVRWNEAKTKELLLEWAGWLPPSTNAYGRYKALVTPEYWVCSVDDWISPDHRGDGGRQLQKSPAHSSHDIPQSFSESLGPNHSHQLKACKLEPTADTEPAMIHVAAMNQAQGSHLWASEMIKCRLNLLGQTFSWQIIPQICV